MNYEQDLQIDETALDVEWLEQPVLMLKYARHAAFCAEKMEALRQKLDYVRASLDKDIRFCPQDFQIEKITENVVSNTILIQPEYQEIEEQCRKAKYEYEIARAAVNAIYARKDSLENLVRLHGMQYFAGPKIPRDLTFEKTNRIEQQKKVDTGVATSFKRKNLNS